MKLISFAVPCYNSADYMSKCIDSLLVGGDRVEIIIVDDGSTDATAKIADEYVSRFPETVRVIHKSNGGHGSGINSGLAAAEGVYFKVVDSDDWVDADAYRHVLETIAKHVESGVMPDLYITNFVYTRADGKSHVSRYTDKLKPETLCDFSEMKKFRYSRMLLMHSLIYKREMLAAHGVTMPEHTFYVDNIFSYVPLPYVGKLYYMDVDFYRYFIGRADQSVSKKNMFARYEQQIRVMRIMADAYSYDYLKSLDKGLRRYMFHSLSVIMMVTIYFTSGGKEKERRVALKELWSHIKKTDKKLYRKLRYRSYPLAVNFLTRRFRFFVMDKSYNYLCGKICLGA